MNTLAERLAGARKRCGLTQSDVAARLNVSFQAVSLWERGETSPEIDKLSEIADLLHVTIDWLLAGKEESQAVLAIRASLTDRMFDEEKMYTYVKTYAAAKGLTQTARVLPYAREKHAGQVRKGKDRVPYIAHPLQVACQALALGLEEDDLISAALLHDVCEDCGVAVEDLPVSAAAKEAVALVTKDGRPKEVYFAEIAENRIATMVKLLDRCSNVSGMAAGFTKDRMVRYIEETEKWFYPMIRGAKVKFPEHASQLFLIKYHMRSVLETIKHLL